jgi:hypothetical protein
MPTEEPKKPITEALEVIGAAAWPEDAVARPDYPVELHAAFATIREALIGRLEAEARSGRIVIKVNGRALLAILVQPGEKINFKMLEGTGREDSLGEGDELALTMPSCDHCRKFLPEKSWWLRGVGEFCSQDCCQAYQHERAK